MLVCTTRSDPSRPVHVKMRLLLSKEEKETAPPLNDDGSIQTAEEITAVCREINGTVTTTTST